MSICNHTIEHPTTQELATVDTDPDHTASYEILGSPTTVKQLRARRGEFIKQIKGRSHSRGDKFNAGRRDGPELALEASWAKTKQGGKESKLKARGSTREFREQI